MMLTDQPPFSLENFEGPLDVLLYLIQKHEIDISEIQLKSITEQFLERMHQEGLIDVDTGAEFLSSAALLLLIKSRRLVPKEDQLPLDEEIELDPKFEVIHQLLDYCRFKEAAKGLSQMEDSRNGVFYRGAPEVNAPTPSGVDHLSVDDLASLFGDLLQRAASYDGGLIKEEEFRVGDLIKSIAKDLRTAERIPFYQLFSPEKTRGELIVTFLAVLELMKIGVLDVVKDTASGAIHVQTQEPRPEVDE